MTTCAPYSAASIDLTKNTQILPAIKTILKLIVEENDSNPKIQSEYIDKQKRLSFFSKNPASVTIAAYMDRIIKNVRLEESTLIIAMIYIDRVCEFNNIYLMDSNIHRVMFAGIIIAIKYNEDDFYSNKYYSTVGGISTRELCTLEYEFVKLLKYSLFINTQTYDKYKTYLINYNKK